MRVKLRSKEGSTDFVLKYQYHTDRIHNTMTNDNCAMQKKDSSGDFSVPGGRV